MGDSIDAALDSLDVVSNNSEDCLDRALGALSLGQPPSPDADLDTEVNNLHVSSPGDLQNEDCSDTVYALVAFDPVEFGVQPDALVPAYDENAGMGWGFASCNQQAAGIAASSVDVRSQFLTDSIAGLHMEALRTDSADVDTETVTACEHLLDEKVHHQSGAAEATALDIDRKRWRIVRLVTSSLLIRLGRCVVDD